MTAMKIITFLALIALATANPTAGHGIGEKIQGGENTAIDAGKNVASQGEDWAKKGEKACENGVEGAGGQFKHGAGQLAHEGAELGGMAQGVPGPMGGILKSGIDIGLGFMGKIFGGGC